MKRRTFVAGAASVPTLTILSGAARAQSKEIRMIESGGASGESIQKGYIDPLKAKTGITVVRESPSSLGKLRALVESGQTSTTLFELGSGVVLQAKKLGLIEKIDWAAVNPAPMFPEAKNEYGFGYQYFSTIMAWRKGAKEPKNFTEFFDTKTKLYEIDGKKVDSSGMVEILAGWASKYPICSIEDGCSEDDWDGWKLITDTLGSKVQLVGDDLFVTNSEFLQKGIDAGCGNAILIKVT